jgi:hypothetical protein
MRIERETGPSKPWEVEIDPWVERALAFVLIGTLAGGGAMALGPLRGLVGL